MQEGLLLAMNQTPASLSSIGQTRVSSLMIHDWCSQVKVSLAAVMPASILPFLGLDAVNVATHVGEGMCSACRQHYGTQDKDVVQLDVHM